MTNRPKPKAWEGEISYCRFFCFGETESWQVSPEYACPCGGVVSCSNCGCCKSCGATSDAEAEENQDVISGRLRLD